MEFYQKLAEARKAQHLLQIDVQKQLAHLGLQVTKTQLSRWETGRAVPPLQQFFALCSLYHIDNPLERFSDYHKARLNDAGLRKVEEYTQDLIASGRYEPYSAAKRTLPLYLLPASAGTGQFLDSDAYEMIEVGDDIPDNADYAIRISGDSMEPRFHDSQLVWVSKQDTLEDGEIGIFFLNGDSYLKKYHVVDNGVQLISLNKNYAPICVGANDTLRVFGRVVK